MSSMCGGTKKVIMIDKGKVYAYLLHVSYLKLVMCKCEEKSTFGQILRNMTSMRKLDLSAIIACTSAYSKILFGDQSRS